MTETFPPRFMQIYVNLSNAALCRLRLFVLANVNLMLISSAMLSAGGRLE